MGLQGLGRPTPSISSNFTHCISVLGEGQETMTSISSDDYINGNADTLLDSKNTLLGLVGYLGRGQRRFKAIEDLAIKKHKTNGKWIEFDDLVTKRLAKDKKSAQDMLKRLREAKILFTIGDFRPQRYYPQIYYADIIRREKAKNTLVRGTGVRLPTPHPFSQLQADSLQEILNSLQWFPLGLHKFQLQLHVSALDIPPDLGIDCYYGMGQCVKRDRIGKAIIQYVIHDNGTILVSIACSSHPFRLETEDDVVHVLTVLSQVRDRLLFILKDDRDRLTPSLESWTLNQVDVNRDIPITNKMQLSYDHLQLVDAGRVFRLYVKSMGSVAVCRAEESVTMNNTPLGLALRSLRPT